LLDVIDSAISVDSRLNIQLGVVTLLKPFNDPIGFLDHILFLQNTPVKNIPRKKRIMKISQKLE
jgi:hypothetical protein